MSKPAEPPVAQTPPDQAYKALASDADAALVDVRTRPEWAFVGLPDLTGLGKQTWLVEWRGYPDMAVNQDFVAALAANFGDAPPKAIYFMCRSGARSLEAARTAAAHFAATGQDIACVNVAEGFEGDLGGAGHRGETNGWKARGLPWRQS